VGFRSKTPPRPKKIRKNIAKREKGKDKFPRTFHPLQRGGLGQGNLEQVGGKHEKPKGKGERKTLPGLKMIIKRNEGSIQLPIWEKLKRGGSEGDSQKMRGRGKPTGPLGDSGCRREKQGEKKGGNSHTCQKEQKEIKGAPGGKKNKKGREYLVVWEKVIENRASSADFSTMNHRGRRKTEKGGGGGRC